MKVIVENELDYSKGVEINNEIKAEFMYILHVCLLANNENELRAMFNVLTSFHFVWGFGGHHFWVKQRNRDQVYPNRIIIVEF